METVDTILKSKINICQPAKGYRFNADSVLLAKFVKPANFAVDVLDIGAGSGVISVLLRYLYSFELIDAIEINPYMYECLVKTIDMNNMNRYINPIFADLRTFKITKRYDIIVSNPPYRSSKMGRLCANADENSARFSESLNLDDILSFSRSYLKNKGFLYFCYDADLAVDAFALCRKYKIEPKRIVFLHPDVDKPARQCFFECRKNAGQELKVDRPLFQKIQGRINEYYEKLFLDTEVFL